MIWTTVNSLCVMAGSSLVVNSGDIAKTVQDLVSKEGFISLATSVVSAGLLDQIGITAPLPGANFQDIAIYSGAKTAVNSVVNVSLGRQSFEEALKSAGTNFVFDVAGTWGANQIGSLYQDGKGPIGYIEHKVLRHRQLV